MVSDSPSDPRRVVALVVNRDRVKQLLECLHQLERLAEPCCGIIVADDASTDGSVVAVRDRFPHVQVARAETQLGPAGARNLGVDLALRRFTFDYLLFLDNDAFVEPTTLTNLLDAATSRPDVGIVAPKAYQSKAEKRLHLAGELRVSLAAGRVRDVGAGEIDRGQYDAARLVQACSGCAMLVRREVVERIGGFDPAFRLAAWEDIDFCLRAAEAGFEIAYAPTAIVEHVGGVRGRGRDPGREKAKARNWWLLMRRHASPLQWACLLALLPLRALQTATGRVREGNAWAIGALWSGLRDAARIERSRRGRG